MPQIPSQLGPDGIRGYQIEALLAESESAWTYRAHHPEANHVALKMLKPSADAFAVLRMYHYARQTLSPAHPAVVRTIEVTELDETHLLATELVDGRDLWKLSTRVDCFDLETAVRTTIQVAYALDTIHAVGLVHRAVTPDHVIIDTAGQTRLLNLGYSSGQESGKHYRNQPLRNDWALAPEARDYNRRVTTLADVYSLGALCLFMLSGIRLTGNVDAMAVDRNLERIAAAIPNRNQLAELLTGCLSARRRDRPRSVWQFARQLSQAADVDLATLWTTPPLAAETTEARNAEANWYIMSQGRRGKSRLHRGTWSQVARSLLHGRLVGHELASKGLGQSFRPLSEFTDFAQLLPPKPATS
ncbi:MAG: protein kinase [Planctomycetota bacterium]